MRVWGRGNLHRKQVWKMAARRKGARVWQHSPCCSLILPLTLKPSSHSQPQKCNGPKLRCLLTLFPPPIPAALLEERGCIPSCSITVSSSAATRNIFASAGSLQRQEIRDWFAQAKPAGEASAVSRAESVPREERCCCCTSVLRGGIQLITSYLRKKITLVQQGKDFSALERS